MSERALPRHPHGDGVPTLRALAPWASMLALFPRDLALAMAPLLPRLAGLLGGKGPIAGPGGDPDGFDGLDRRGSYERLLPSEWLLLSEAPDEFLRRVAMSEHAFLRLSRRLPPAGRDIVVLLDAGPDQLGSPRIVHIAALVVLAARAERAKGTLSFGVIQSTGCALHPGFSVASVTAMLDSGSLRPPSADSIAEWLALEPVRGASERWIVGGEDLRPASATKTTCALVVTEPVEIDARRLNVTALTAGDPRERTAVLDLPEERVAVRLLRDPFESRVAPALRPPKGGIDVTGGLVLAENGHRLFLRDVEGRLVSVVIPSSPRMPAPRPAVLSSTFGAALLAVGFDPSARRPVVVCRDGASYLVCQLERNCRKSSKNIVRHKPTEGTPFPEVTPQTELRRVWFPASQGLCFFDPEDNPIQLVMGPVARVAKSDDAKPPWEWRGPPPKLPVLPEGATCEGVLRNVVTGDTTHVVLLDPTRTRLELFAGQRGEVIARTQAPICRVVVSEAHRLVAYLTESGHVGVHSVAHGATLVSMSAGERLAGAQRAGGAR